MSGKLRPSGSKPKGDFMGVSVEGRLFFCRRPESNLLSAFNHHSLIARNEETGLCMLIE